MLLYIAVLPEMVGRVELHAAAFENIHIAVSGNPVKDGNVIKKIIIFIHISSFTDNARECPPPPPYPVSVFSTSLYLFCPFTSWVHWQPTFFLTFPGKFRRSFGSLITPSAWSSSLISGCSSTVRKTN